MAIYEYQCESDACEAITERIQSIHNPRPESIDCKVCGKVAVFKISASAILSGGVGMTQPRGGMGEVNQTLDVIIARDADVRRKVLDERQGKRDKVRRDTNSVGLTATSVDTFAPISANTKQVRTDILNAVKDQGYKPDRT